MFKILSLQFIHHPFFDNLEFKFVQQGEHNRNNYISFILGPNGTGKSKILLSLINILNSLDDIFNDPQKKYTFEYKYNLVFENRGDHFHIRYDGDVLWVNEFEHQLHIEFLDLPEKVIVSCFSFNDKYPLREQRGKLLSHRYHYLGLKSTTNNIFISNPTKAAVTNLYNAVLANKDIAPLKDAFSILELKPKLTLVYKSGKNFGFLKHLSKIHSGMLARDFQDLFEAYILDRRRTTRQQELRRFGDEKIETFFAFQENVDELISYLGKFLPHLMNRHNKEIALRPVLDLESAHTFAEFTNHVQPLKALSDLEIISFNRFEIKKEKEDFSFDDASSGEYHIILTFLNILSLIEDNSLVMLDEPEISLHPNWQIRYMEIFSRIFSKFPACHFIIASHSHFLVSDLIDKHSTIIGMSLDDKGEIKANILEENTFGWSAEQILLDVFGVATTRNYYLTRVVGNILEELSKVNPELPKIKSDIRDLMKLDLSNLNENDPLKAVIEKLTSKVNAE
jgi:predicted ATPase